MEKIINLQKELHDAVEEYLNKRLYGAHSCEEEFDVLVACKNGIYEGTIEARYFGALDPFAPVQQWVEGGIKHAQLREDLCLIYVDYVDEEGAMHHEPEIVTAEEAEAAQQMNETVEVKKQVKYICNNCGYIEHGWEIPTECSACLEKGKLVEIDHFETEWFGPHECEMVVTKDGKRSMI